MNIRTLRHEILDNVETSILDCYANRKLVPCMNIDTIRDDILTIRMYTRSHIHRNRLASVIGYNSTYNALSVALYTIPTLTLAFIAQYDSPTE